EVTYQTREPQLAAQIVNSVIDQYLDKSYRSRYEATLRAAQSLSPRLNDLQKSIKKSTDELLSFQKSHEGAQLGSAAAPSTDGIMGPATAANGNPVAVRVAELNQQL